MQICNCSWIIHGPKVMITGKRMLNFLIYCKMQPSQKRQRNLYKAKEADLPTESFFPSFGELESFSVGFHQFYGIVFEELYAFGIAFHQYGLGTCHTTKELTD